ncbi:hypothetical protein L6164_027918 [Bauhinia variegata]|uniref:Uncharacterized protein n=1 Tax=Bauhinia variegata TaxID=167791 RepID=A0ACB9LUT6_BAUVA|nr:hypothetical protein L6164_027918 [Bauhinia variegata]
MSEGMARAIPEATQWGRSSIAKTECSLLKQSRQRRNGEAPKSRSFQTSREYNPISYKLWKACCHWGSDEAGDLILLNFQGMYKYSSITLSWYGRAWGPYAYMEDFLIDS